MEKYSSLIIHELEDKFKQWEWVSKIYESRTVCSLWALAKSDDCKYFVKFIKIKDDDPEEIECRLMKLKNLRKEASNPLPAPEMNISLVNIKESKFLLMTVRNYVAQTFRIFLYENEIFIKKNTAAIKKSLIELFTSLNAKLISHLNIKPENMFFDQENMRFIILDWESFLCKRRITKNDTAVAISVQKYGDGFQTDLFSLACIFLNILRVGEDEIENLIDNYEKKQEQNFKKLLQVMESQKFKKGMEDIKNMAFYILKRERNEQNIHEILNNYNTKLCIGFCQNKSPEHQKNYIHVKCKNEGKCKLYQNLEHRMQLWHPPMCKYSNSSKWHPPMSLPSNKCFQFEDQEHRKQFLHPPYECVHKGLCTWDFEPDHLKKYTHPPFCQRECDNFSEKHMKEYSHHHDECNNKEKCELPSNRENLFEHVRSYRHPFLPLCRDLYKCSENSEEHKNLYSHPCEKGVFCEKRVCHNEHSKKFVHIKRKLCHDDSKCLKIYDQNHLEEFAHSNISEVRKKCTKWPFCIDNTEQHLSEFSHPSRKRMCFSNVYGENKDINFEENANFLEKMLDTYMTANNLNILPEVLDYCRNLRPQHRCKFAILKMILSHGALLSKWNQNKIEENMSHETVKQVFLDKEFWKLMEKYKLDYDNTNQFVSDCVEAYIEDLGYYAGKTKSRTKINNLYDKSEEFFKKYKIGNFDKFQIRNIIRKVSKAAYDHKFMGRGYSKDELLGTDRTIFSIIGNNREVNYGNIVLILKQEVMHHPDFNMTPTAGTNFLTRNCFKFRPWLLNLKSESNRKPKPEDFKDQEMIELYHKSKINASLKNWAEIMAKELTCKAFNYFVNLESMSFNKSDSKSIISYDELVNSHFVFEGHMPPKVPLSMVERVVINEPTNNLLNKADNKHLREILMECLNDPSAKGLIVINRVEDVYNEIRTNSLGIYQETTPKTGFCFSLLPRKGDDVLLPSKIATPNKFRISFEVLGSDFHLRFTPRNSECSKSLDLDFYYLVVGFRNSFNFEKNESSNFYSSLVNQKADQTIEFLCTKTQKNLYTKLDRGCDYVKFLIEFNIIKDEKGQLKQIVKFGLDASSIKVTNALWDSGSLGDNSEYLCTFLAENMIDGIKYITVSCWDTPVFVKNFTVESVMPDLQDNR